MKLQNGPPGARAFSRLPNDKKGKALGTRLGNLQTVIERDVAHLSEEEISMSLLYFENLEITYNTKTFVVTKLLLKKE
jgi:hypothetical protein